MDCFYAAIECRDDPSVADKPVGVGGSSGRGVLSTCNYIAREYGCHSAMPVFQAKQKCPHIVLKPHRFSVYKSESDKIRSIFYDYTELVEPLSLDEAYLDVTHQNRYAWDIAKEIRQRIFEETQLAASAGVSYNKMLAKIASDWKKPNGQFAVLPNQSEEFMKELPVRKIWGIGPKSAEKLSQLGFDTCGDLQKQSIGRLHSTFGTRWGTELYQLCHGIDERSVTTNRIRKSMSVEHTFDKNLESLEECIDKMEESIEELKSDLMTSRSQRVIAKLFVKLKFEDFKSTTKEAEFKRLDLEAVRPLLEEAYTRSSLNVRLMGLGVRFAQSNDNDSQQLELDLDLGKKRIASY
ncbi:DNA polymerase IV [Puniceicoccaceae bacterium K14]|nr:DNA polymerase IV [Puniceicoccaceae bacterium K14]